MATQMALPAAGQAPPQWIRILPLGRVELVDHREPLTVDEDSLKSMVAAFHARGVDVVIDYEHQSLQGERAPAAGWIKQLEARPDGLWARVEWTAQAREYLANREYRYFSPVLGLDPESRRPAVLMHLGLTNLPAIKSLPPLVAKAGSAGHPAGTGAPAALGAGRAKEKEMESMDELKGVLGLTPETGESEVALKALDLFRELAAALNLAGEASPSQLKGAVAALKAGAERFSEVQEELRVLKDRLAQESAAQVMAEALQAGKVTPAQKDWALEYYRQDPEGFQTFVARAPQVVPTGEIFELLKAEPGGSLAPEEQLLCQALRVSADAYLKAKAQTG